MTITDHLASAAHRSEQLVFRAAMGLPEVVQRRLAGRPVVHDGQTLAVDTQLMLRLQHVVREPVVENLPISLGRAALRRQAILAGGDQPIGAVRDLRVADLPARLYLPSSVTSSVTSSVRGPSASTPGPLLVFFHGGGWIYGDLDSHDAACRFLAERSGVRVLAVEYRLAPEAPFPAACQDAESAYAWVVSNAAALGADPDRLAVGGDSAGACLATTTAMTAARQGLPLAFQLLIYPGTDHTASSESRETFAEGFYLTRGFMELATTSYLPKGTPLDDPLASPLYADVPAGLAPAYVVTAGFDPLRDEGEAYARKLSAAGVEVELKRYPDQIHGFFNIVGVGRTARAANAEIAAKLGAALAKPS